MSIGCKIRLVGYYIKDLIQNKKEDRIFIQWNDIKDTLLNYETGWSKVEKNLQHCLDYATENCEFYKQYKGKSLKEFPTLNKIDFIKNFDKIKNPLYENEKLHKSSTSGSTGTPFTVVFDRQKRNRVLAELQYFGEIAGYKSHEKMSCYRAGHKISLKNNFLSNVWIEDASILKEKQLNTLYKSQTNAKCVYAYASSINDIIRGWKEILKKNKGSKSVELVLTSSDMLRRETREHCKEFWPNAKIYSRYANMENGVLAQEYSDENNKYKWNWSSYYIEILKFDSDEPAEDGELGRIVITDMFNKAFPMIRYDNGDVGSIIRLDNDFPILYNLNGRRTDSIYDTTGNIMPAHTISNIMWGLDHCIIQWQFIQEGAKEYKMKYISNNAKIAEESIKLQLNQLKKYIGIDAIFEIEKVEEIPILASYKRQYIVQNYKKV